MIRQILRTLFWTYLFFVIFEGAFRKWILPGYSNLFLVVRDPLVVLIYTLAMIDRRFPFHAGTLGAAALGLVAMVFSVVTETTEVVVLLYGFKAAFLHVPLIWVVPEIIDRRDLVWVERAVLALLPVMALLMSIQFQASPDSIWNVGPGGSVDAQMEGALGRIRPPGLFSFITGAAQFCGLATAFLLAACLRRRRARDWWWLGALILALLVCTTISISRMLVVMTVAPCLMLVFLLRARPELMGRFLSLVGMGALALVLASGLEVYEEGAEAFNSRLGRTGEYHATWWERAENVVTRMMEDPVWAWRVAQEAPLFGLGLGSGTNVAAATRTGRLYFVAGEGEWVRMVMELGPLLAGPYLLFRCGIALSLLPAAWRASRHGDGLPFFLAANAIPLVVAGQWGQATTLGFSVMFAGLVLATSRHGEGAEAEEQGAAAAAQTAAGAATTMDAGGAGDPPGPVAPPRMNLRRLGAGVTGAAEGAQKDKNTGSAGAVATQANTPARIARPARTTASVVPVAPPAPAEAGGDADADEAGDGGKPQPPPRFRVRPRPPAAGNAREGQ